MEYHKIGTTVRLKHKDNLPEYWNVDSEFDGEEEYNIYYEIYHDFKDLTFVVEIKILYPHEQMPACILRNKDGRELGWEEARLDIFDYALAYEDIETGVF